MYAPFFVRGGMELAEPVSCEKSCGGLSILHFSNVLNLAGIKMANARKIMRD
jgi:hypothetical protein